MSQKAYIFKQVHEVIGDNLPESHVFYATQGLPSLTHINKVFGNWYNFSNAYLKFIKSDEAIVEPVVPVVEKEVKYDEITGEELDE